MAGKNFIMRTVGDGQCSKKGCEKRTYEGYKAKVCCCDSDLCNAAPRSTSSMSIGFMTLMGAFIFAVRAY